MTSIPSMSVARRMNHFTKYMNQDRLARLVEEFHSIIDQRSLSEPEMLRYRSIIQELQSRAGVSYDPQSK